ncbi:MAG: hypothetical protein ASARMPREDX12_006216 [Alectoria sarmentosa]|nr:MAG: hypothetical protein ASARMPREDX12_006216 [Alectoria sarmentosa]
MAPATELATIPLASGAAIEDADSPAGKVWQSTLDTVSQQDGFQRAYYGREVENQSVLQLFIGSSIPSSPPTNHATDTSTPTDWDSLDHHKQFIGSPTYGPFAKHLMTIVDGPLTMLHANFAPHPPTAALGTASPVTEVLTFYFEGENDGFDSKLRQFIKVISDNAEGFKAASGGWVIEDVEYKGKKGKAYVAILGWESVEAHMNFRETQTFKDSINIVRADPLGMEVHHTEFLER